MPKVRTAQQNHDWWIARAEQYDREALLRITTTGRQQYEDRAAAARAKAASYLA